MNLLALLALHPKQAIALTIAPHDTLSPNATRHPPNIHFNSTLFTTLQHYSPHQSFTSLQPRKPRSRLLASNPVFCQPWFFLLPPFFEYILFLYSCLPAIFVSPPQQEYRNEVYSIMFQVTDVVPALILKKKG